MTYRKQKQLEQELNQFLMIDSDSVVWCIERNKVGTKEIPDLPDGD